MKLTLTSKSGLHSSFKQGLSKLLWIQETQPEALEGSVWLSVSSFVAYLLTGRFAEEETLAARTFVYRMDKRVWNLPLIQHFGLDESHFSNCSCNRNFHRNRTA
ncbi:hypothetical protein HQN89_15335 [Paenibacillus frigoriresistens]|uniref:FGGY family carbohydrate kinase n=1 Tax=Paenibacillus alginolyticus TaxID=59839 RepID=UPI0015661FBF|nr:FGGY family carbohydrate kinase [Paenibacillus frigoriresistens]NRF92382.1 hypothetical protein [Paenibacillus frigoriresistens]